MGDPSAGGGKNKWNKWENVKRQVYNLSLFLQEWIPKGMESWNYPKTVENAVTMLSHYMNNKVAHMKDEDKGQTAQKSFM
jgi:hypothetical protein